MTSETESALGRIRSTVQRVTEEMSRLGETTRAMDDSSMTVQQRMEAVTAITERNSAAAEELSASSAEVLAAIANVASVAEESSAAAEEVSASTEEVSAQVEETAEAAARLAQQGFGLQEQTVLFRLREGGQDLLEHANVFKAAHRRWVERVRVMAEGGPAIAQDQLVSHHHCALGRWYDGIGSMTLGHLPAFQALSEPHAHLHELAARSVEAHESGRNAEAQRLLAEMEQVSHVIIGGLEDMMRTVEAADDMRVDLKPVEQPMGIRIAQPLAPKVKSITVPSAAPARPRNSVGVH